MNLKEEVDKLKIEGYSEQNAMARICQDIVLVAISKGELNRNITIKGGVVMRNISHNQRRTTQDLDLDFIRYSISNEMIEMFVQKLNCLEGLQLELRGEIEELKHQDYKGKRIYLNIRDEFGNEFVSKLDIGVHKDMDILQEEYCFDICFTEEGASLLMNSFEQMFVEKLKSILRFGAGSTRYTDVYDICYLTDVVDKAKVLFYINKHIFIDNTLAINNMQELIARMQSIVGNKNYMRRLGASRKNWLQLKNEIVFEKNLTFLEGLKFVDIVN